MPEPHVRYFLTYRGVKLPLQLADEVDEAAVHNRGTFFRASYDERGRLVRCEKVVYGDIELEHRYTYDAEGTLREASVACAGDEPWTVTFGR